jgi:hypothetical protein
MTKIKPTNAMRRFAGVAIFLAIYVCQLVAFNMSLHAYSQSIFLIFIIPAIFIFGWVAGGLVLGELVLKRPSGLPAWGYGFLTALLTSVIFVLAVFAYQSSLPNTGRGL